MIVGVGIDLVQVERMRKALDRHGARLRERLFTRGELADCESQRDPAECLAARFAAKEAALKALGTGKVAGFRWTDLEIRRSDSGRPRLTFSGGARERGDEIGARRLWVSLSHDGGQAVALVVLEGGESQP